MLFTFIESEYDLLMTLDTFGTTITIFYQTFLHLQHYPGSTHKLMYKVGRRSIDRAARAPQLTTTNQVCIFLAKNGRFWAKQQNYFGREQNF